MSARIIPVTVGIATMAVVVTAVAISPNTDWQHHWLGGALCCAIPLIIAIDWARRVLKDQS